MPDHPYSIAPVFRTHYQCVTLPDDDPRDPLARHNLAYELASEWAYADHVRRNGPGRIPIPCDCDEPSYTCPACRERD
ncbi:hypothetical protein ASU32_22745 [Tsukamurella tyrosinosolvens]|nr:hypothetical protein ASU32_22745 [Tsukamurella tyrosinosolvens]